jgi:hypothetical protein
MSYAMYIAMLDTPPLYHYNQSIKIAKIQVRPPSIKREGGKRNRCKSGADPQL